MFTIEGRGQWSGLFKVMEECGELITVCAKLGATGGDPRYWGNVDLRERLIEEIGDVLAAIDFFMYHNASGRDRHAILIRRCEKFEIFQQWRRDARTE